MSRSARNRILRRLSSLVDTGPIDPALEASPPARGITFLVTAIAIILLTSITAFTDLGSAPGVLWALGVLVAAYVGGAMTLVACGNGISNDSAGMLGVALVCAFGPDPLMITAFVAGGAIADLRAPALVGGPLGAMYNAAHLSLDMAFCGATVVVLLQIMPALLAYSIGVSVYSAVNLVTIAPALIGLRGTLSPRRLARFWRSMPGSVLSLPFVLMSVSATIVVVEYPSAALVLLLGPVILAWNSVRSRGELALAQHQVGVDELTGLPNRRALRSALDEGVLVANRDGIDLALLIGDLDDFKQVNDTLGHAAGDEVLRVLASTLAAVADEYGMFAARYGGEEFAVVATGMSRIRVEQFAEDARRRAEVAVGSWSCSLSIGAAFHTTSEQSDDIIERADQAMYMAKQLGKNRVVIHGDASWRFASLLGDFDVAINRCDAEGARTIASGLNELIAGSPDAIWQPDVDLVNAELAFVEGRHEQASAFAVGVLESTGPYRTVVHARAAAILADIYLAAGDGAQAREYIPILNRVPARVSARWAARAEAIEVRSASTLNIDHLRELLGTGTGSLTGIDRTRMLVSCATQGVLDDRRDLLDIVAEHDGDTTACELEFRLLREAIAIRRASATGDISELLSVWSSWSALGWVNDGTSALVAAAIIAYRNGSVEHAASLVDAISDVMPVHAAHVRRIVTGSAPMTLPEPEVDANGGEDSPAGRPRLRLLPGSRPVLPSHEQSDDAGVA